MYLVQIEDAWRKCLVRSHNTAKIVPSKKLACKYARIGCKKKVILKDRTDHESVDKEHLQVAIDTVHKHQGAIHLLREILNLKYRLNLRLSWKCTLKTSVVITECIVHLSTAVQEGTRCISVYFPMGMGGAGIKMSLSSSILCMESDDHLAWPFTGTVYVALLNQIEDKNHPYRSAKFISSAANESSQRVDESNGRGKGFGWITFCLTFAADHEL